MLAEDTVKPNLGWKVLAVNDNAFANKALKLVLDGLSYSGKGFLVLESNSLKEAKRILEKSNDIAIVIVAIVVQKKNIGKDLIHFIRKQLKNSHVRIILRTGYPNSLPEKEITENYEIDACLSESELSENQIKHTFLNVIQTHNQLKTVTNYLKGLGGSIAHEMRHPLAMAIGSIDAIKETLQGSLDLSKNENIALSRADVEELIVLLDLIHRSSSRSNMIIDMILNNIRDQSHIKEQYKEVRLSEVVHTAMNEYVFREGEMEKVAITLTDDFVFKGDSNLMVFVLFNLFKNAFYYVSPEEGKVWIWVENGQHTNKLFFKDNGIGISEDKLPFIFDGFITFGKKSGTGLGLNYCKKVMNDLGGSITCESVLGQETTFTLEFPAIISDSR